MDLEIDAAMLLKAMIFGAMLVWALIGALEHAVERAARSARFGRR